mgnify:FL=1
MIKYFLIYICGFDPVILKNDDIADLTFNRFAYSFLTIILLSILANFIVFYNTIENIFYSIIIAVFFSLIIINLYRLIIVTSSPYNLKITLKNIKNHFGHYIIKIVLLLMIFFVISKPIETYIFKNKISKNLEDYKINSIDNYRYSLEKQSNREIEGLIDNYEINKSYKILSESVIDSSDLIQLEIKIKNIEEVNESKILDFQDKIDDSNLFFQQIKILTNDVPESNLISLLIIVLIFYPLYLILYDENFMKYFKIEEKYNNNIISSDYVQFSTLEKELFYDATGFKLEREAKYSDPPFNKKRIQDKNKYFKKGALVEWFKDKN